MTIKDNLAKRQRSQINLATRRHGKNKYKILKGTESKKIDQLEFPQLARFQIPLLASKASKTY